MTVGYLLAGGFLIFLAVTITRDNFGNRLNRATGAMLLFAGTGPVFLGLGLIGLQSGDGTLENSALYGLRHIWSFFFPCLLIFSWLFPVEITQNARQWRGRLLVFLPQLVHVIIGLFFTEIMGALEVFEGDSERGGISGLIVEPLAKLFSWIRLFLGTVYTYQTTVFGVINLTYVAVAVYFLETGRQAVTNPQLQVQTKWVLWGFRVGLSLYAFVEVLNLTTRGFLSEETAAVLLVLAALVSAGVLIVATIRHQFLDVRMVFKESFVTTVTSALLVGVYILAVLQAEKILAPMFGVQARMVSYGFIILILLFFQPINNWLDNLIRTMFIRMRTDHRNVIERFSRQVISLFDPSKLRKVIEETFKTSLLVDNVYFVLFDDEVGEYAVVPSDRYPRRIIIAREDLLLRGINLLEGPASYSSLNDYKSDSELAAILDSRGVRMILPMKDADHMLGFVALTGKAAGYRYSSEDMNLLGVLSNQMVSALTNARLYVESLERLRLQEEINMARQIQIDLLPSEPPRTDCSAICATSTPSRTVGGDFYDFIKKNDHQIGIVIADASGKGMPAALMIAQTQAMIRSEVNNGTPIATMLANINTHMAEATSAEKYVTLFYAELDIDDGTLEYCNAGHNYPILVKSTGDVEHLETGGPIIGAFSGMSYESSKVKLESEDLLFLFTDGLSEAMDSQEVEYGEDRIMNLVADHRHDKPDDLVETILSDVRTHDPSYPPRDDTTVIALKMLGGNGDHHG